MDLLGVLITRPVRVYLRGGDDVMDADEEQCISTIQLR